MLYFNIPFVTDVKRFLFTLVLSTVVDRVNRKFAHFEYRFYSEIWLCGFYKKKKVQQKNEHLLIFVWRFIFLEICKVYNYETKNSYYFQPKTFFTWNLSKDSYRNFWNILCDETTGFISIRFVLALLSDKTKGSQSMQS